MPGARSGFLVQSTHGTKGNFELAVPREGGGVAFFFRNNDAPGFPWYGPIVAFGSFEDVTATAMLQSTQGSLELIVLEGAKLVHYSRDDGGTWKWKQPTPLPGSVTVTGPPAFVQSKHFSAGNFEVVAPVAAGGLAHWWRDNDHPSLPWHGPHLFGQGNVSAVAMAQTNYGAVGNLEVIARVGNDLVHYFRDDGGTWNWSGPFLVGNGADGSPAFIQSALGTKGHFEVVTPATGGGLKHYRRNNDQPGIPWLAPVLFGSAMIDAVGLVHSNFGALGNLEIVGRGPNGLGHFWRDDGGTWHGPFPFGVEPPETPATTGQCTIPHRSGIVAVHAVLLRTGKVLVFSFGDHSDQIAESRVFDPVTGALETPAHTPSAFCSGHAVLPDGVVLVAGGHHHHMSHLHAFDPTTSPPAWEMAGMMSNGRWYPTCTTLSDGKVLIISGTKGQGGPVHPPASPVNHTLQVFDATGVGPEQALPTPFSSHFPPTFPHIDLYPFVYALPSGEVLVHSRNTTRFYDPSQQGPSAWSPVELRTVSPTSRTYPVAGTSILLPLLPESSPPYRAHMLVIGGGGADPEVATPQTMATSSVEWLDLGATLASWRTTASMAHGRVMPDAVLLPDGTVAVVGGSATGKADQATDPVLPIEMFDPASEQWTTMCSMRVPRLYHSTALLLPDATVFIAGKDGIFNADPYKYPEHRVEVFKPPYLFRGPRPTIAAAPAAVTYGQNLTVTFAGAAGIASVVLIRPGSVTHSFNMDQRMVGLSISGHGAGTVTAVAPPDANVAPPGPYMLFILNPAGVPSEATFVMLS
jgi:Galactose oxidase-like, Early set domain/Glyoxal oxidase N-terminus